jgi:hypothetical protein
MDFTALPLEYAKKLSSRRFYEDERKKDHHAEGVNGM